MGGREGWLRDAGFPFRGDGKALKLVTGDNFLHQERVNYTFSVGELYDM